MATGYVTLFDASGNGLGIASAATTIDFGSRTISATTIAGTLSTAAQTNVTSLGTLSGLTIQSTSQAVWPLLISTTYPAIASYPTSSNSTGCAISTGFINDGAITLYNTCRLATKSLILLQTTASPDSYNSVLEILTNGDVYHPGALLVETTTQPTLATKLQLFSSTQNRSRLTFSGQEFYQAANTSTEGMGLVLAVNRTNNRQIMMVDTANASIASTTNNAIRFYVGSAGATIDAISTDCVTGKMLTLGNGYGVAINTLLGSTTTQRANDTLYLGENTAVTNFFIDRPAASSALVYGYNTPRGTGQSTPFQIYNNSTARTLMFSVATAGSSTGTNAVNVVPILNLSTGVSLPTSGGTATTFDYYEENLSVAITWTGIWAAGQSKTAKIVRVGSQVTAYFPEVSATTNTGVVASFVSGTGAIPARYRPTSTFFVWPISVQTNSAYTTGKLLVSTAGTVTVFASPTETVNFTTGTSGGMQAVCLTWHIK